MLPGRAGCRSGRRRRSWASLGQHGRMRSSGFRWPGAARLRDRRRGLFRLHTRRQLRRGRFWRRRSGGTWLIGLARPLGLHWLASALRQLAGPGLPGLSCLTWPSRRRHRLGHALSAREPVGPVAASSERALGAAVPGIPRASQRILVSRAIRVRRRQDGPAWPAHGPLTWPRVWVALDGRSRLRRMAGRGRDRRRSGTRGWRAGFILERPLRIARIAADTSRGGQRAAYAVRWCGGTGLTRISRTCASAVLVRRWRESRARGAWAVPWPGRPGSGNSGRDVTRG